MAQLVWCDVLTSYEIISKLKNLSTLIYSAADIFGTFWVTIAQCTKNKHHKNDPIPNLSLVTHTAAKACAAVNISFFQLHQKP